MWKKILEKVFPMSRKGQQERFDQLFQQNEALQTMLAQQSSEILKRKNDLNQCLSILQEVHSYEIEAENLLVTMRRETIRRLEAIQKSLVDVINTQNKQQQHGKKISEQLLSVQTELEDIKSGDLFRRIEFLQGKLIFIEEMLQKNAMNLDGQRSGAIYEFILRMQALFPVEQARGGEGLVRIGRDNDGGYLMWNDFSKKKIAYSIGINDDVSWDHDMAMRGLSVYQYDHTIEDIPEHLEQFHFYQRGLGTVADADNPQLMTLPQMLEQNGHLQEKGMILKIDIEGAEWEFLNDVESAVLEQFSQIVFEFHNLTNLKYEEKMKNALKKLNKTHQLIHIHPNNYGSYLLQGGKILPELIEGTYLLRTEYEFMDRTHSFPVELDQINCPYLAEISLGEWNMPVKTT